jgi:hypothetical protein
VNSLAPETMEHFLLVRDALKNLDAMGTKLGSVIYSRHPILDELSEIEKEDENEYTENEYANQ